MAEIEKELQNEAKIYQNELANSINNPNSIDSEKKAKIMIIQFQKLCQLKKPFGFTFDGSVNCIICEKYIGNDKYISLNCYHNIHVSCGQAKALSMSPVLDNIFIECNNCKQLWVQDNIIQLFGREEYQRIQDQANQELIEQLMKEEKLQQQKREQNVKFTCVICDETKIVNNDCITLDCDHRYCQGCINKLLQESCKNGKALENELVCPQCSRSITLQILQAFLTKDQFDKISERRLFEKQDSQYKYVRCPFTNNELKQKCLAILEIGIDAQYATCPFCDKKFCVNGCTDPHVDYTCEQFRQWQRENGQGDQAFETLVQNEKIARCSKCQMFVQKNQGCNHMTCRCRHEFCYVCNGNWRPRTCQH